MAEPYAPDAGSHLLMNGRLSTARQIAEVLSPSLPEPMRMYVVECRPGERAAVTRLCEELTGGRRPCSASTARGSATGRRCPSRCG
ncbi:hypothetical protein AB0B01_18040 [Streptomyces sp. NPDC044571]|uniref:hypothetical protein n=1 Tax=Streptomyces sp. NPDC044571 TaxID=3155371 RepID=UPI0033FAC2E0